MICECGLDLSIKMTGQRLRKYLQDQGKCPECGVEF